MREKSAGVAERPTPTRYFGVMGAHGGAGTSTVARWLDPHGDGSAYELARGSQLPPNYVPLVVCRSTSYGVAAAVQLLGGWHPDVPRPYLVVVRDAPLPLPRPVRYRLRVVRPRVLGIADVPYLVRLREMDTPADGLDHKTVRKAVRSLRRQLGIPE